MPRQGFFSEPAENIATVIRPPPASAAKIPKLPKVLQAQSSERTAKTKTPWTRCSDDNAARPFSLPESPALVNSPVVQSHPHRNN
jgi:hypothetical protein